METYTFLVSVNQASSNRPLDAYKDGDVYERPSNRKPLANGYDSVLSTNSKAFFQNKYYHSYAIGCVRLFLGPTIIHKDRAQDIASCIPYRDFYAIAVTSWLQLSDLGDFQSSANQISSHYLSTGQTPCRSRSAMCAACAHASKTCY